MIRIQIPGFDSCGSGDGRYGDCQIATDDSESFALVIDSYCGKYADMVIDILKSRGLKKLYLYCTHPHYDHLDGLKKIMEDSWFDVQSFYSYAASSLNGGKSNGEIRSDINYLNGAISLAKERGIPTHYLDDGDKVIVGEIKFNVYRQQDAYQGDSEDPHGWAFVNDGSLCFYFPEIRYWTSGDGPMSIYDMCEDKGAKPVIFKIPHHGNNCNAYESNGLKSLGAKLCWDNSYSTNAEDDFLKYGRRRCIEAGIQYVGIHGDINIVACSGHIHVYKDWQVYSFPCPYNGKNTFKAVDAQIVQDVINGKAGSGNARMSYLINHGYNPLSVQKAVNEELSKPVKEGWIKNDKGWWYRYSDRTWAIGWAKLPTEWFYFDENGYMVTGWMWDTDRKCWFYLDPKSGAMWAGKWLTYKGRKCWLKPSGRAAMSETLTIDGKTYVFDKDCYATEITDGAGPLNGVDIASYQAGINPTAMTTTDFVIVKMTQGTDYINPYAEDQYNGAKTAGKLLGAYHYAEGGNAVSEAQYFLEKLGSRVGECIIALDWEGKGNSLFGTGRDVAWCKAWLDEVYKQTGVRGFVYMSKDNGCRAHDWSSVAKDYPLWGAQYASNNQTDYQSNPWTDGNAWGAWGSPAIHQYSSHGDIEGYNKNIDIDLAYMGRAQWLAYASGSKIPATTESSRDRIVALAQSMVGIQEGSAEHHAIIDTYNAYGAAHGYPRGYKVKYTDAWCATFISALAIKCGLESIIPIECGCPQMITIAQSMGEWVENDAYAPQVGDIVLYDWQDSGSGDNTGTPDHVGICTDVSGNALKITEGNYKDAVSVRSLTVNSRYIRGYIVPKY